MIKSKIITILLGIDIHITMIRIHICMQALLNEINNKYLNDNNLFARVIGV